MYLHYFESGTYKTLKQLLKLQKQIPKWNENSELYIEMQNILKDNNINFNKKQVLNLLDNTIKRFRIKIEKVISKFMKERNITERIAWSSSTGIIREIIRRADEIEEKII
jgi:3-methyladenine DNA glycosylase AlkC